MKIGADLNKIDSTSLNDSRITVVGNIIRKYKIDELAQLINVLNGSMSLVGPRPNVKRETDLYTLQEKLILSVKPGITDFSSIVFSDEAEILEGKEDPNISYNQLIRPWKSRLAIIYVKKKQITLLKILVATERLPKLVFIFLKSFLNHMIQINFLLIKGKSLENGLSSHIKYY